MERLEFSGAVRPL